MDIFLDFPGWCILLYVVIAIGAIYCLHVVYPDSNDSLNILVGLLWGPILVTIVAIVLALCLYWGLHALMVSIFLSQETRQTMRLERHQQQANQEEQAR